MNNQMKENPKQYVDGAVFPFGDTTLTIKHIRNRDMNKIRVYLRTQENEAPVLCLATGIMGQPDLFRQAVAKFLKEYARRSLGEKVTLFSEKMKVKINTIRIKEQRTRWGSCSSKGNLNFNWKLVFMPDTVQNYIVVHELAHRKQMNHSVQFWNEVENILPDYKERQKLLRSVEKEVLFY
ncbi:MAG: M48 family metallopeptidase [Lachnospiraceae bacterium]